MRVFVAGGTGLVGTRLIRRLRERQDEVVLLTRRPTGAGVRFSDCTVVEGDPMRPGTWMDAVDDCDAVVNLVGENIFARRWNEEFIALLRDSRVLSTKHMVQALARKPRTTEGQPRVLVNASAIGYYGPRADEEITEASPAGQDTLAKLTVEWEQAARAAEPVGIRIALIRIGIVLDNSGGALAQMLPPFRMGIGGRIGNGAQWMSWIHFEDMVGILLLAVDNPAAAGPINATAPHPATNKDFTRALGRALHRPTVLPIPAFALKLRFGGVADILTTGQRVLPKRALALGYRFRFPDIDAALADVLV
jgi:uncharacterized protein (TIGR01777 family)